MKALILAALMLFVSPALAQEEPAELSEQQLMEATIVAQQKTIDFLVQGYAPPTTHVDPAIPPDKQLVEATSPRSAFVNHEARIAAQTYVTEVPKLTEVTTKHMPVPDGWRMVEIPHPPLFSCTEYPQPSTWELRQIQRPVQITPVGEENAETITIITGGE